MPYVDISETGALRFTTVLRGSRVAICLGKCRYSMDEKYMSLFACFFVASSFVVCTLWPAHVVKFLRNEDAEGLLYSEITDFSIVCP